MTKLKKIIKNNWMMTLIYTFGLLAAIVAGWLLGRPNMLHATAFSNSSITYNEGQILNNVSTTPFGAAFTTKAIISSGNSKYAMYIEYPYGNFWSRGIGYYVNGTLNNNVITFSNIAYQNTSYNSTTSCYITINADSITVDTSTCKIKDAASTLTISDALYSQEQYDAYGTQQYNLGYSAGISYVQAHPAEYNLYTAAQYSANYTAGQNSVINSPNSYGLYTQAQYEANYTSGYNAGVAYVQNHPSEYNLYTTAQYNAYGSSQYTAGQNAVLNNPNSYNLYTTAQYNSYGSSQYTAGETAVQNDPNSYGLYTSTQMTNNYNAGVQYVLDHPAEYNLYTTQQYNAHAQEQYNAGYLAGQQASTNYQDGIQYVLDHLDEYGLYTTQEYNAYGVAQYNSGKQYVLDNLPEYGLYTTAQYNAHYAEGYNAGLQAGANGFNYIIVNTCSDETTPLFECFNSYDDLVYSNGTMYFDNINDKVEELSIENAGQTGQYYTSITLADPMSTESNYFIVTKESLGGVISFYANNTDTTAIFSLDISNYDTVCTTWVDNKCTFNLSNYINTTTYPNYKKVRIWSANYDYSVIQFGLADNPYYTGYNNGETVGYERGLQEGLNTSNVRMYEAGYNAGIAEDLSTTNSNTLVGLTGTILMSPVKLFKDIFNFEFLGVNLGGFFLSIITLIVVAWLIKRLI